MARHQQRTENRAGCLRCDAKHPSFGYMEPMLPRGLILWLCYRCRQRLEQKTKDRQEQAKILMKTLKLKKESMHESNGN